MSLLNEIFFKILKVDQFYCFLLIFCFVNIFSLLNFLLHYAHSSRLHSILQLWCMHFKS